jgi:hypothetical protein
VLCARTFLLCRSGLCSGALVLRSGSLLQEALPPSLAPAPSLLQAGLLCAGTKLLCRSGLRRPGRAELLCCSGLRSGTLVLRPGSLLQAEALLPPGPPPASPDAPPLLQALVLHSGTELLRRSGPVVRLRWLVQRVDGYSR